MKNLNRRSARVTLGILLLWMLAGCGKSEEANGTSGAAKPTTTKSGAPVSSKTFRVGVSLLKEDDEFYQVLKKAMQDEAAANNLELDIQSANNDLKKQTDQVDNFLTQQVDAIILCPVNSDGVAGAVQKANEAKVPVFTADIAAHGGEVVSHIASDNKQGGRLIAAKLIKLLNGKGSVAIIGYPEVTSVADRVAGFREEIAKSAPGINIVEEQSARGERAKANEVAANLLLKHGKALNALFGINDNTALGAQAAAEQAKRNDLIIVGYDGAKEAQESIKDPKRLLKADAVQYPDQIGKTAIETVAKYLKGDKSVPKLVPVPCGVMDKETIQRN